MRQRAGIVFRIAAGLGSTCRAERPAIAFGGWRAYISRHYAPRSTEKADWRTERLFYTRENALIIDAVRERIEEMYPGTPEGAAFREKAVLIAALLYQAATHTNTSGSSRPAIGVSGATAGTLWDAS